MNARGARRIGASVRWRPKIGVSRKTVNRVWRAFGLQPHRSETFKLSTDPLFIDKVRDIVGLYMKPAGERGGVERG